jgi:rhodanese-related sulfurtransferase
MMRKSYLFIVLAAASLAALPGCNTSEHASSKESGEKHGEKAEAFGKLSVDEVEAKLKASQEGKAALFVFDNNAKETYTSGHVPGAKWISPKEIKAEDLPSNKEATLVFYCANEQCGACHDGATAAIKLGYKNVYIMPAGIAGWKKAGKQVEQGQS